MARRSRIETLPAVKSAPLPWIVVIYYLAYEVGMSSPIVKVSPHYEKTRTDAYNAAFRAINEGIINTESEGHTEWITKNCITSVRVDYIGEELNDKE